MDDLRGKRLLILGATGLLCRAVETAKQMGIYTVVTDYYPHSPAKQVADKSYDVSTTDIDTVERIAREERIDGVFTGFSDVNLYSARALCDRLGLPFYATKEQLDSTTNKLAFKKLCRKYGVPTVKQYQMTAECLDEDISRLEYPVIVKPADSYASKGVSICYGKEKIKAAAALATKYSKTGEIIVEHYYNPRKYCDFCAYYIIQEGDVRLCVTADRTLHLNEKNFAPLPIELRTPSKHLHSYLSTVDSLVRNMFQKENFQNGTIFMQGFALENTFCFFEIGYRLNGMQEYEFEAHTGGNNALKMYIEFALTGKFGSTHVMDRENPNFPFKGANVLLLLKPGTIKKCVGIENVSHFPGVINVSQLMREGDTVGEQGTLGQVFARVHVVSQSEETLERIIRRIRTTVHVLDENGNNLIVEESK